MLYRKKCPLAELPQRFWDKVETQGECLVWVAARNKGGYGIFFAAKDKSGKTIAMPAHRAIYEVLVGKIPEGYDMDHLCRNRACIHPNHLEPVTRKENVRRGIEVTGLYGSALNNKNKTHCVKGHEFTEKNTRLRYTNHGITRRCLDCGHDYSRNRWIRDRKVKIYKHPTWQKKRDNLYFVNEQP